MLRSRPSKRRGRACCAGGRAPVRAGSSRAVGDGEIDGRVGGAHPHGRGRPGRPACSWRRSGAPRGSRSTPCRRRSTEAARSPVVDDVATPPARPDRHRLDDAEASSTNRAAPVRHAPQAPSIASSTSVAESTQPRRGSRARRRSSPASARCTAQGDESLLRAVVQVGAGSGGVRARRPRAARPARVAELALEAAGADRDERRPRGGAGDARRGPDGPPRGRAARLAAAAPRGRRRRAPPDPARPA